MEQDINSLEYACAHGKLYGLLEKYILFCRTPAKNSCEEEKSKGSKQKNLFPNIAGFCRFLNIGELEYESLEREYPEEFGRIRAALEDEALNSEISPTVLSAYLKKRLGYEKNDSRSGAEGQMRIVFEHDIIEDGE